MNKKQKNMMLYNNKKKNPTAAALWSLVFIFGGQFYNEQYGKGILFFFLAVILWFILMGWIMWIVSPIDAYHAAKKYNENLMLELDLN